MSEITRQLIQTPCYCIRLRRAAGRMTDYYDSLFEPFGVSVNQFSLMISLRDMEGCGTGELARHVGLEKSTLVRSLRPLVSAGFVEDTAPAGGRSRRWRLTSSGNDVVEAAFPAWKAAQEQVRTTLDGKHRLLMELLRDLEGMEFPEQAEG